MTRFHEMPHHQHFFSLIIVDLIVKYIIKFIIIIFFCLALAASALAIVSGPCSDCHTMHNSQDGSPMTFDDSPTPNPYLTRGTCIGCHGQNGLTMMVDGIPQVNHRDPSGDLAAGNFAYMLGTKGVGGASDAKGHNVKDFGNLDDILTYPPGGFANMPDAEDLTCAGIYGCHGTPFDYPVSDPMASIAGAHHADDSTIDGSSTGKSYRFLSGVTGLEVADWQNTNAAHHNEYQGASSPNSRGSCSYCHLGDQLPAEIAQNLGAIDRLVHAIDNSGDGIWLRHPFDTVIPDTGEYASYTSYNIDAPVGRVIVPDTASDLVVPGTDVVTCLSCHFAHASDYPDLLRWDYDTIIAGEGDSGEGCFICHSTKDD